MYRIVECLTQEHSLLTVVLAALICTVGSFLSVQLAYRVLRTRGRRRQVQTTLFALIGGTTIWSTHFIAMLAYDPGVPKGNEPFLTGLSLAIGIMGMAVVLRPLHKTQSRFRVMQSGWLLGNTIVVMHYTGMAAFQVPGDIVWDRWQVALSVVLGCTLSTLAIDRTVRTGQRFDWLFAQALLILAICSMHFTGMSAITIDLSPLVEIPEQAIPDRLLGFLVFGVSSTLFLVGFASMHVEVQAERESLRVLAHAVNHDHLTGLPNRNRLRDRLDELDSDVTVTQAVLTLHLDHFKHINDLHGFQVGDAALVELSHRLQACLTAGEMIFRTGGNEFVGLKSGIRSDALMMDFPKRLQDVLERPIQVGAVNLRLKGSLGLASNMTEWASSQTLLQRSNIAMNHAKADRDMAVCLYDAEMDRKLRERFDLIEEMSGAIGRGEMRLVYQLQNNTRTGEPVGAEALLRWQHPERGPIRPDIFISLAEETGQIVDIGRWVLQQACSEAATWPDHLSVAVNVAPQQISQPSFPQELRRILHASGLSPDRLELEVTEASVIDDQGSALNVIKQLRVMGVRLAMDDFGTGYSSLATFRSYPFDKLKIDRSFVQDVHLDGQRAAIVRAIMFLGEALNLPVLAEGVETEEELAYLRDLNCDSVQGFLFGKPLEVVDLHHQIMPHATEIAS